MARKRRQPRAVVRPPGLTQNRVWAWPRAVAWHIGYIFFGLLLTTGPPWWVSSLPPLGQNGSAADLFKYGLLIVFIIIGVVLILFSVLDLFRDAFRRRRDLLVRANLHSVFDKGRDIVVRMNSERAMGGTGALERGELRELCDCFAEYLRVLLNDRSVKVALRCPFLTEQMDINFSTVARSQGFSAPRTNHTEPIGEDSPIINQIRQNNQSAVILIPSIWEAPPNWYYRTEADENCPNDVTALAAVPVNGWDGVADDALIGVLYAVSGKADVFNEDHIDVMAAFADYSSTLLSAEPADTQDDP